eukprot:CAMPEP_0196593718 /NCGR_PEP_ID=MMETSP1081-20130531/76364_1 /TAXON_ID=36882 /ORGANISM="Pyramimonas amylifera, Strain CCMP720" /LENGTH=187 /DNA_ID=CAMNT_0041917779 /DNA_START=261 /DNA_END=821 /DNA_ORIENTATION=+
MPLVSQTLPQLPSSSQRRDADVSGDLAHLSVNSAPRVSSSRPHTGMSTSTGSEVSEWRRDKGLSLWYAGVQNRKKSASVKLYKQAVKDAQWILERRARQMKEIRERQKAEDVEAARVAHQQMNQGGNQRGNVKAGEKGKEGAMPQRGEGPHNNFMIPSSGHSQSLNWQEINEVASPSRDRTKDVTVW